MLVMGRNKNNCKKISLTQKMMIVEIMEMNPHLNSGKCGPSYTLTQRANDWKLLGEKLNRAGGTQKSVEKWQKCWLDLKSDVRKKSKATDRTYLSNLDCRILALVSKTVPVGIADVDSKEALQRQRISEETSLNENADPEHSDSGNSVDSSCVLALHDSYAESVDTRARAVPHTIAAPVKETTAPPLKVNTVPETRVPLVSETCSLASDKMLPDQTIAEVVVLDPKNCEKLIAVEEASGAAIKSIALQLGQLVKAESRKATALERTASAFERIADAVDRLSNNFCP